MVQESWLWILLSSMVPLLETQLMEVQVIVPVCLFEIPEPKLSKINNFSKPCHQATYYFSVSVKPTFSFYESISNVFPVLVLDKTL